MIGGQDFRCAYCDLPAAWVHMLPNPHRRLGQLAVLPRRDIELPFCNEHRAEAEIEVAGEGGPEVQRAVALRRRVAEQRRNKIEQARRERRDAERQRVQAREDEQRRRRDSTRQQEQRRAEQQAQRRTHLINRITGAFRADFLSADQAFHADPDAVLISPDKYRDLKADFAHGWAEGQPGFQLDSEQAAAVSATGGDIQVVARAGSGKTRALVARALFLQKHCRVSPRELLLLAFNKKAAEEIKQRIAEALGGDPPHVMTFHALAYALIHPDETLLFDDNYSGSFGRSREVQDIIDELIRSPRYQGRIRALMLAHFQDDWERIVEGNFQLSEAELLAHRRALPDETLNGEYVKSYGEKAIANALFEHAIDYRAASPGSGSESGPHASVPPTVWPQPRWQSVGNSVFQQVPPARIPDLKPVNLGAPGGIRTPDPWFRRPSCTRRRVAAFVPGRDRPRGRGMISSSIWKPMRGYWMSRNQGRHAGSSG